MTSDIFWNGGVHYHCPMMTQMRRSGDWILHIADCAVTELPGTKYNYKEWDVMVAGYRGKLVWMPWIRRPAYYCFSEERGSCCYAGNSDGAGDGV